MRRLILPVLFVPLLACKAPPEAPTELADLCNYLFRTAAPEDYDEEALVAGLNNLDAWLQADMEATTDGYAVNDLDQDSVAALDIGNPSTDNLVGAAVAYEHVYQEHPVAVATSWADQEEVLDKTYAVYDRTYDGDIDCFAWQECDWIEADSYSESSWAGLIDVQSTNHIQFRWVEVDGEMWMIHRSWLNGPATVSWEELQLNAQYFLAITMPASWAEGGAIRMMTTWIDAEYAWLPVSEDTARLLVVKSMDKQGEMIDEWLDVQMEDYGSVEAMLEAGG